MCVACLVKVINLAVNLVSILAMLYYGNDDVH